MVKQINPSISRKIIHKYDKIFRSPLSGNRCRTPNIRMYKIKRGRRKGVTFIKGQFCLFAKMTGSTIKFLNGVAIPRSVFHDFPFFPIITWERKKRKQTTPTKNATRDAK